MTVRISSDKAAVVDTTYHWKPITPLTSRGAKVLLINRNAGVCTIGSLGSNPWWTHWAPLPTWGETDGRDTDE